MESEGWIGGARDGRDVDGCVGVCGDSTVSVCSLPLPSPTDGGWWGDCVEGGGVVTFVLFCCTEDVTSVVDWSLPQTL